MTITSILLLTSCLRTRGDIGGYERPGDYKPAQQTAKNQGYQANPNFVPPQQQKVVTTSSTASNQPITNINNKDLARLQISLQEINDQIRVLNGRIEVLEKKVSDGQAQANAINIDSKLKNYEQALANLEAQVQTLKGGVANVSTVAKPAVQLNAFGRGEKAFREKNWQKAISEYQLYREQYPKGKDYSEATYKIGVCFQELNMKSEARAFYQEAVSKYPSSKAGKKAKFRLKQL